ncbi:MAG: 2-dehydropantoate 2-reductase [Butyrivibrio sp.]|nr:2-dehydropantoate 2-reductase [Butyrivibrio sp.]
MKITVIGPGAMGLLYGAKLSAVEDVLLIGNNEENIRAINENGVTIKRDGDKALYHPKALVNGQLSAPADLLILFTKAYKTREALNANRNAIGPDTILLTLQNGAGHEEVLREFADEEHILIGTSNQGSSRENGHVIVNSGLGDTNIGPVGGGEGIRNAAEGIAAVFEKAGFPCRVSDDIKFTVWNKLMINASSSVLSGVLGKAQGYVAENPYAWDICRDLIREICQAAAGEGCAFSEEEQIERIHKHLMAARGGFTSIYADLKNRRKTEVDYISGAVVRAAARQGRKSPAQEMMLRLVHAME